MKPIAEFVFASSLFLSETLLADKVTGISPEQLPDMQQHQNALVVDIRTEAEWQNSGVIANSHTLQSFDKQGHFDLEKSLANLQKMKSSSDQPVILIRRFGNRSDKVGTLLAEQQGLKNIYYLDNGLQSWLNSGHPLLPNCLQVAYN